MIKYERLNNINMDEKLKDYEDKWWEEHNELIKWVRFEREIKSIDKDNPSLSIEFKNDYAKMVYSIFSVVMAKKFNDINETIIRGNKMIYDDFINKYESKLNKDLSFMKRFAEEYIFNLDQLNNITRQEKFLKEFPNMNINEDGCIDICPKLMEGSKNTYECDINEDNFNCKKCKLNFWNKIII